MCSRAASRHVPDEFWTEGIEPAILNLVKEFKKHEK